MSNNNRVAVYGVDIQWSVKGGQRESFVLAPGFLVTSAAVAKASRALSSSSSIVFGYMYAPIAMIMHSLKMHDLQRSKYQRHSNRYLFVCND
jgi:hypothetical protein